MGLGKCQEIYEPGFLVWLPTSAIQSQCQGRGTLEWCSFKTLFVKHFSYRLVLFMVIHKWAEDTTKPKTKVHNTYFSHLSLFGDIGRFRFWCAATKTHPASWSAVLWSADVPVVVKVFDVDLLLLCSPYVTRQTLEKGPDPIFWICHIWKHLWANVISKVTPKHHRQLTLTQTQSKWHYQRLLLVLQENMRFFFSSLVERKEKCRKTQSACFSGYWETHSVSENTKPTPWQCFTSTLRGSTPHFFSWTPPLNPQTMC